MRKITKNVAKALLSSAVLVTGASAADYPIVFDSAQSVDNDGRINIGSSVAIKIAKDRWIENTGTISFIKSINGDTKFKVLGTDNTEGAKTSGIKNKGAGFAQIDGLPTSGEVAIEADAYYHLSDGGGIVQVKDPLTEETRPITDEDYIGEQGGAIVTDGGALYSFLTDEENPNNNAAGNVVVLRGQREVLDNTMLLDHHEKGEENVTTAEEPLDVKNPIVNSIKYKTFKKDEEEAVNYDNDYALGVKGYYKFTGENTEFTGKLVEFMEGSSEFNVVNSIFPSDNTIISGGNMNINMTNAEQKVDLEKTIDVTSHLEEGEQQFGCLKITSGRCHISENGILNLGVPEAEG